MLLGDPLHPLSGSARDGNPRRNDVSKGAASATAGSNVAEVRIDIGKLQGGEALDLSRQITHRVVDDPTAMIVETTQGLGGQAVGAVMAVALSNSSALPLYVVELSIIVGLSFTYAAIPLRRRRPDLSAVAANIGAIATALAIIIAAASSLPPLLAFTVIPYAMLVVSAAIVFA